MIPAAVGTTAAQSRVRRVAADALGSLAAFALFASLPIGMGMALGARAGELDSAEFAEEGFEDDCLVCHDETAKTPVLPILATQHGVKGDSRTPLAGKRECQTCHGPSAAHAEDSDTPVPVRFGPDAAPGPQNEACLGCHQGGDRINWQGSIHASSEVACASCHSIHAKDDLVMVRDRRPDTPVLRADQTAVCFRCHADKRADINKASAHPLRDGLIACSDCHNPHGSMGPTNLQRPTLNETCFTCHAEKRGPFLWEHAPASEDCATCHDPHGSNHPSMLKTRVPQLCQSCHAVRFHPSTAYGGPNYSNPVPGGVPVMDRRAGAKGCLNCHVEVHGSNHPSGSAFTR